MNRHRSSYALYCLAVAAVILAVIALVQWLKS
jgi:hypothetical protein